MLFLPKIMDLDGNILIFSFLPRNFQSIHMHPNLFHPLKMHSPAGMQIGERFVKFLVAICFIKFIIDPPCTRRTDTHTLRAGEVHLDREGVWKGWVEPVLYSEWVVDIRTLSPLY